MKKIEQADPHGVSRNAYHRYLKRTGRRIMRRLGKKYLDDAPKKLYFRGYET